MSLKPLQYKTNKIWKRLQLLHSNTINHLSPSESSTKKEESLKNKLSTTLLIEIFCQLLILKWLEYHKIFKATQTLGLGIQQLKKQFPFLFSKATISYTTYNHIETEIGEALLDLVKETKFNQVEQIGWIYQFFIATQKAESFDNIRKRGKATTDDIPFVTQLFTPKWIVKYLNQKALKQATPNHTFCDIACGSGHILIQAFDVFYKKYEAAGFDKKNIPQLILKNNLFGYEIDNQVAGLAKFALLMKAHQYDKNILTKKLKPNIKVLDNELGILDRKIKKQFDVIVTNPPYMQFKWLPIPLKNYLKKYYNISKADLFAAFMHKAQNLCKKDGYIGFITPQSWLYLSAFKKLRKALLNDLKLIELLHLGKRIFQGLTGEVVQSVAFIIQNTNDNNLAYKPLFIDVRKSADKIHSLAHLSTTYQQFTQAQFLELPNQILCYNQLPKMNKAFRMGKKVSDFGELGVGMTTSNNERFVKYWWEVDRRNIGFDCKNQAEASASKKRWFPYNKGGNTLKWYGNQLWVVDWAENGKTIKAQKNSKGHRRAAIRNEKDYFKPSLTWTFVSSREFSLRYTPQGAIFDSGGSSLFVEQQGMQWYLLGLLNSSIGTAFLKNINPSLNFQVGDVSSVPVRIGYKKLVDKLVRGNVKIAQQLWDNQELSWNFGTTYPTIGLPAFYKAGLTLAQISTHYLTTWNRIIQQLHDTEQQLNHLFEAIYGFKGTHSTPTAKPFTLKMIMEQLISYCIGKHLGVYGSSSNKYLSLKNKSTPLKAELTDLFGEVNYSANLAFIESILGVSLNHYIKKLFYKKHFKQFRKCPIYVVKNDRIVVK